MNYFGALVNFSGTQSGLITFYDANFDQVLQIDPVSLAYQANTAADGSPTYSLFLNVTSMSGIADVQFTTYNGIADAGAPTSRFVIADQAQAVGTPTADGTNGTDVPEPGAIGSAMLLGVMGLALHCRGGQSRRITPLA